MVGRHNSFAHTLGKLKVDIRFIWICFQRVKMDQLGEKLRVNIRFIQILLTTGLTIVCCAKKKNASRYWYANSTEI